MNIEKCIYCKHEMQGNRHESLCPYNPENTRKLILFLRDYVLQRSTFNKNFCPFPKPREFDKFCRVNKIARLKTISKRYLEDDLRLNDWLIEVLDYSLGNEIISSGDFPYFLQYIYDAWIFNPRSEYKKIYQQSIEYEDATPFWEEVGIGESSKVKALRSKGVNFLESQIPVKGFYAKGDYCGID